MTQLIILSGFLGAGKTTLMLSAAEVLRQRGKRVACITNDQGSSLVDSNMVLYKGLPLRQIEGGCFCCRFEELVGSIRSIIAEAQPDVVIAEAVGSCTDLAATVVKPLRAYHAAEVDIRPLTVVVDPERWMDCSNDGDHPFSKEIVYLYRKQLEEANCILINKADLLINEQIQRINREVRSEHPAAKLLTLTAHEEQCVGRWLDHILTVEYDKVPSIDIDYNLYGKGEAQLGWLNSTIAIEGQLADVHAFCNDLAVQIAEQLRLHKAEVAHLKIWAQDSQQNLKLSLVRNAQLHRVDQQTSSQWSATSLTLWINARVYAEAALLKSVVERGLREIESRYAVTAHFNEMACFAPGWPTPVHRIG